MDSRNKELYEAVKQGNENKVKDLISQGANVNWHNPDYYEWVSFTFWMVLNLVDWFY